MAKKAFHGLRIQHPISDFALFLRYLRIAAAAHDWGKANDGFQAAVQKSGDQVIRHEHLSGLLLFDKAILAWLRWAQLDATVILSAVISHHVKSGQKNLGEPPAGSTDHRPNPVRSPRTSRRSGG